MKSELVAAWLLTLCLHAGVLLTLAWLLDRNVLRHQLGWREWVWRLALFGGLLTASGQMLLDTPKAARIATAAPETIPSNQSRHVAFMQTSAVDTTSTISLDGAAPQRSVARPAQTVAASPNEMSWMANVAMPAWYQIIVAAWMAGVLLSLSWTGRAWLRMRHKLDLATPLGDLQIDETARQIAALAGVGRPDLLVLDELASPVAVGGRRIILPSWVVGHFDDAQMRALLAHEIAHLSRRDPARKLASALVCSMFWFMPLASVARRRLDEIAEEACDAWAAAQCGDGRALAECLFGCAEHHMRGPQFALASAMSRRHSPVLKRINQLIDGVPMKLRVSLPQLLVAIVITLAAGMTLLPGVGVVQASAAAEPPPPSAAPLPAKPALTTPATMPAPPAPPASPAPPVPPAPPVAPVPPVPPADLGGTGRRVRVFSDSESSSQRTSVQLSDGNRELNAKMVGDVQFNAGYDDIERLARGATASFGESIGGSSRRVDYANPDGTLQRHYFVDGTEQPFDATASQWIAEIVPAIIRETAVGAVKRVHQLHTRGGASAVLDEIAQIRSDYARGVYIKELAAIGKLSTAEVTRALALIDSMSSDYERRNALTALGTSSTFNAEQQTLIIRQAEKIQSDYERAELLLSLIPSLAANAEVRQAWLQAANGIKSDYEHRRCLSALVEAGSNDDAILESVINAASTIGSSYERRELLTTAISAVGNVERLASAYAGAIDGIDADYERRQALMALIHARGFGKASAAAVLDSLAKVNSDFECREVLTALAAVMPNDPALISRYRDVARKLSNFERGEAERALDRFAG
jgi:beta-lactamase regulating signal transducer with metallopeptidase domain